MSIANTNIPDAPVLHVPLCGTDCFFDIKYIDGLNCYPLLQYFKLRRHISNGTFESLNLSIALWKESVSWSVETQEQNRFLLLQKVTNKAAVHMRLM